MTREDQVEQAPKPDAKARAPANPNRVSSAAPRPARTLAVGSPQLHLREPLAGPQPATGPTAQTARPRTTPRRASPRAQVTISGGTELWHFEGETPSLYAVQQALTATAGGLAGTFQWTIRRGSRFADFGGSVTAAGPNVTLNSKLGSAARNDVQVRVDFTGTGGQVGHATRRFTVRRPDHVRLLRNHDHTDPAFAYQTDIHKKPIDQFGRDLPRGVEVNEQFTSAPTADFPGMDWRASTNQGGFISPPGWLFDLIQGETSSHTPTPVAPTDRHAGVKVNHWPGVWRIGSMVVGRGRQVASVIWQKFRGRARHR